MQLSFDPTSESEREFVANMLRVMMTHAQALKIVAPPPGPTSRKKSTANAESTPAPLVKSSSAAEPVPAMEPAPATEPVSDVTREQLQNIIREFVLGGKQEDKARKVDGIRAVFTREFGHPLISDIKQSDLGRAHELFQAFKEEWK